jgi:hypothetical protein
MSLPGRIVRLLGRIHLAYNLGPRLGEDDLLLCKNNTVIPIGQYETLTFRNELKRCHPSLHILIYLDKYGLLTNTFPLDSQH